MKNSPKVSIIAPVYNTGAYLEECILSVLGQTFEDWELILVDDGSTDNSLKIEEDYSVRFPEKIRTIRSNSGCVSKARNKGFEIAEGEYVYFLDSDDSMTPRGLELLFKAAQANPDVDFFQGSFRVNNMKNGKMVKASRFSHMEKYNGIPMTGEKYLEKFGLQITYPWNSLIRRSFLASKDVKFPPDIFMQEDLVFIIDLLLNVEKAMYVDNEGVVYRFGRPDSLTNIQNKNIDLTKRRTKRLGISMVRSAKWLTSVKVENTKIRNMIYNRILDNLTGILYSSRQLLPDRTLIDMAGKELPHISVTGFSPKEMCARIYNISPNLALFFRRFI